MTARSGAAAARRLSPIVRSAPQLVAAATLTVETAGPGLVEFTADAADFSPRREPARACCSSTCGIPRRRW